MRNFFWWDRQSIFALFLEVLLDGVFDGKVGDDFGVVKDEASNGRHVGFFEPVF